MFALQTRHLVWSYLKPLTISSFAWKLNLENSLSLDIYNIISLILSFWGWGIVRSISGITSAPQHEAEEMPVSPSAFSKVFYDRLVQETLNVFV